MSEWQPIETAPKDGTRVLVFTEYGIIEAFWSYTVWAQMAVYSDGDGAYPLMGKEPTHWMPLPEPPKGK